MIGDKNYNRRIAEQWAREKSRLYDDKTKEAVELFERGLAPSEIDARLSMPKGTAKALMVAHWADERKRGK